MSVKASFFSLAMFAFVAMIAFEFYNWKEDREKVEEVSMHYGNDIRQTFQQILVSKETPYIKLTRDYATWDALAQALMKSDTAWMESSLRNYSLQFGNDGFFILNHEKQLLFSDSRTEALSMMVSHLSFESLDATNDLGKHFFVRDDEGVVELFVASVVFEKNPVGYIIVARVWNEASIQELSAYGVAEVSFGKKPQEPYTISQEITLLGMDEKPVATLYLSAKNHLGEMLDAYAIEDLKLSFVAGIALMAMLSLLIVKFISRPLNDIMLALEFKDKEPLKKYLLQENEYDAIAEALCDAFDTKHALEELNATLEQKVQHEVEQSRLKDRIVFQQAKSAALGEMLSNIAHQWKQPLNTISLAISKIYLDNKMQKLSPESLEQELTKLRTLIQNMSSTMDDFRDFFHPDGEKVAFKVSQAIYDALRMCDGGIANKDITVNVACDEAVMLYGFPKEFSQVMLVLLVNAKEAIMKQGMCKGCIDFNVQEENERVTIRVSDNGGGIEPSMLPQLFEPFFTTKEPIGSNGMGLYLSKKIIEQSLNGKISVENASNGLVFTMVFPKPL